MSFPVDSGMEEEEEFATDGSALQDIQSLLGGGDENPLPGTDDTGDREEEREEETPEDEEEIEGAGDEGEEEEEASAAEEAAQDVAEDEEEEEEEEATTGPDLVLTQQLADQTRLIAEQGAQIQQLMLQAQAPKEEEAKPEAAEIPDYTFNIPSNLIEALVSGDPNQANQALTLLLKGAATAVHKSVREEQETLRNQAMQGVQANFRSENTAQQQRQAIVSDFYGTFPGLNRPIFKQIVDQVSDTVQRRRGDTLWTPELRDAIAAEAVQQIKTQTGLDVDLASKVPAEAKVPGKTSSKKKAKAKKVVRGKGRRASSSNSKVTDDILSLLDETVG